MTVNEAIDYYLDTSRTEGKEPATIVFYEGRFARLRAFLGDKEISEVKAIDIIAYAKSLPEEWSNTTKHHNLAVVNILQRWLWQTDLIEKLWSKKISMPSVGRRDRLPTAEETAQLLEFSSPAFARIYRALRLCGARPGELCNALISDWRRDHGVILLEKHKTARKVGKPRVIVVSAKLQVILEESIAGRTEGRLFLTERKLPWFPPYLSRTYTQTRKRAGLPRGLVLYLARHEAITRVCQKEGIAVAADFAGHATYQTTKRYCHLDVQHVRKASENLYDEEEPVRQPQPTPEPQQQKPEKPRFQIRADLR